MLREAHERPGLIAAIGERGTCRPLDASAPQIALVAGTSLPAAPLSRRVDAPEDCQGTWLRADPVGLVPDLAAVWLQPDIPFEPGAWSEALRRMFADEGLRFELTASGRGYLELEHTPDCRFLPPWLLAGESLEHCLPAGPEQQRWRRLLNETQVLLHQHGRDGQVAAPIPGSLWFWGAGALPDRDAVRPGVARIVADDPVLEGLADWLGIEYHRTHSALPRQAGTLIEWPADPAASAEANLEALTNFLRPAWRRLRAGRLRQLVLADRKRARSFSRLDAWRVWR